MPPPPPRDPFDVYDRPPMGIGQMPVNVPPQYAPAPYAPIPDMRGRDDYPPRRDDYRRDDYPPRRDDYRRDDAPRDRSYDDRHERRRSPSPRRSWDATDKCVLYVRDLPPQMNTPERVFALFCTYGKIEKIKIIKDKCAIVQFVNNAHAATAREYLDSTFAFGSNIRVHHSTGYDKINTPRDNTDPNIADYKDSELNRYVLTLPYMSFLGSSTVIHLSAIYLSQRPCYSSLMHQKNSRPETCTRHWWLTVVHQYQSRSNSSRTCRVYDDITSQITR